MEKGNSMFDFKSLPTGDLETFIKSATQSKFIDIEFADISFAVEIKNDTIVGIFCDEDLRYLLKPNVEEIINERVYQQRQRDSETVGA